MSLRLIYGFHAIIAKLRQAPGKSAKSCSMRSARMRVDVT